LAVAPVTVSATAAEMATGGFRKWVVASAALAACAAICFPPKADAIERRQFAALHRAAKDMQGATVVGVSYSRFSELAKILAIELLAAKDRVGSEEDRELVSLYAQAGLAYGDSLTLWREKIERKSSQVSSTSPRITPLISRYRIPLGGASAADQVDADSAIRLIWTAGNKALRKAELRYDGREHELAAVLEAEKRAEAERAAAEQSRAAEEAEHQRALTEQVAEEFDRAEREAKRPKPFEASVGNWTCPRGYVVRRGRCLADEEIARSPRAEMGR
jgi:nucleoid-associated protein YgaU